MIDHNSTASLVFLAILFLLLIKASIDLLRERSDPAAKHDPSAPAERTFWPFRSFALPVIPGASVARACTVTLMIFLFVCFVVPVFRSELLLYSSFTDDFFYYLNIAVNFNKGLGLSYTPGFATNGYQPLHQFLIVVLVFISRVVDLNELIVIKIFFGVCFLCSCLLLFKRIRPTRLTENLLFCLAVIYYYLISYSGMESIFIVPLLSYLAIEVARKQLSFSKLAILAALAFFVRVDSIILIVPLMAYAFFTASKKHIKGGLIAAVFLFLIPVAFYLLVNHWFYGSAFPVSGIAKTVASITGIHPATFQSFYSYKPYNIFNICLTGIFLVSIGASLVRHRTFAVLLFASVTLYYLQSALRSDWGLWSWYFYPMPVLGFFLAVAYLPLPATGTWRRFSLLRRAMYGMGAATAVSGLALIVLYTFPLSFLDRRYTGKTDILHIGGFRIKDFEVQNKGVYAMGDRAGITGYLLESPLIQLEGLVMDKQYLVNLRAATKLSNLLYQYNVDYYIASNPLKLDDSTYVVKEPVKSNGYSKHIVDTINWKVEHRFRLQQSGLILRHAIEANETVIFRVPK